MTVEEAKTILKAVQREKRPTDSLFDGLSILHKTWKGRWYYSYNYGQIFACPSDVSFADTVNVMSKEDITRMGELGWYESEESWSYYML